MSPIREVWNLCDHRQRHRRDPVVGTFNGLPEGAVIPFGGQYL